MFISTTLEDLIVKTKQLIAEHYETLSGRKRLIESLHHEIEKAAHILKRKYCYDATIAEYLDDFRQSFSLYLMEHSSIWKRALSFDSVLRKSLWRDSEEKLIFSPKILKYKKERHL